MNQDDLKKLLDESLKANGYISANDLFVFGRLIKLTLSCRNQLKYESGEVLTVEDARIALDIYLDTLKSNQLPHGLDKKIERLVKIWLKEINGKIF